MDTSIPETIAARYERTREQIQQAARKAGRNPNAVRLVVVTKGHPAEALREVVAAGATNLGENYAEEAVGKMQALSDLPGLTWHMIGHVQSRKARLVAERFEWVHSVDSLKLANRLNTAAEELGRTLQVLLECNVSGEESKFGFSAWERESWAQLVEQVLPMLDLPHIQVRGLMTMAPYFDDPELARPTFRRLRELQDYLRQHCPHSAWDELSMGMSGDFEAAIQEGATVVRVGTAIMGPRPYKA